VTTRRAFLCTLAGGLLAAPLAAQTQQTGHVPRIGFLRSGRPPRPFVEGFEQGLRELGYVDGQNIIIEYRYGDGSTSQLAQLGGELLRLKVDVIVASATAAALAAKQLTRTVPVVIAGATDPVDSGIVNSLSRPGGNITGTSLMSVDLLTKRLELLKDLVPRLSRAAVLGNLGHPSYASQIQAMEAGARSVGIQVESIGVRGPNDFKAAFRAARKAQALIQLDDALFTTHRHSLVELAVTNQLPAIYGFREHVEAGGLVSYGPNFRELYRQVATYVDKILKGAKPADLPVEQPTKFELIINLKTAKMLGLAIPPSLLARADEAIE
jgi:putative ABC transport system substrate-binding protein